MHSLASEAGTGGAQRPATDRTALPTWLISTWTAVGSVLFFLRQRITTPGTWGMVSGPSGAHVQPACSSAGARSDTLSASVRGPGAYVAGGHSQERQYHKGEAALYGAGADGATHLWPALLSGPRCARLVKPLALELAPALVLGPSGCRTVPYRGLLVRNAQRVLAGVGDLPLCTLGHLSLVSVNAVILRVSSRVLCALVSVLSVECVWTVLWMDVSIL